MLFARVFLAVWTGAAIASGVAWLMADVPAGRLTYLRAYPDEDDDVVVERIRVRRGHRIYSVR